MSNLATASSTPAPARRTNYRLRRYISFGVLGLFLVWLLGTFLVFPTINLLIETLFPGGQFSSTTLGRVLGSERVLQSLWNSLLLAVLVCVTVNILGIFEILVLEYFKVRGSRWLRIAYFAPMVLNGMTLVMAYSFMVGERGFFTSIATTLFPNVPDNWFIGMGGVLFQLTFANTMNHILFVTTAIRQLDNQIIEAARNMGVSTWRILWKIVLPSLKPALFGVTILIFAMGITAFATPLVLGGPDFQTINPLVLEFSRGRTTMDYAAIMALFLGLITAIVMIIFNRIESRGHYRSVSKTKTPLQKQEITNPVARTVVTILAHIFAIIHVIPLLFVVIFSFMPVADLFAGTINLSHLTLDNYAMVFNSASGVRPVLVSVFYSAFAALLSVAFILLIARLVTKYRNPLTGALEWTVLIPWFLPGTLIALGLLQTFVKPQAAVFGQVIQGTLFMMLIGYVIMQLPFTFRMMRAAYAGVDDSLEDAARNLGAGSMKTFIRVLLPILMPAALMVFLQNLIAYLAEYEVSVFLFHPLYQPLGVLIEAATNPEAGPQAQMMTFVYAVIIMVISASAIWLIYGREGFMRRIRGFRERRALRARATEGAVTDA